jgi:hypothetical protein
MRTDITKQIVAFRNFANAPKIGVTVCLCRTVQLRELGTLPNASIIILSAAVLN